MRNILFLVLSICFGVSYADCLFRVINYSRYSVGVVAGFYGGESASMTVGRNVANTVVVKSNYNCISANPSGAGIAHINLSNNSNYGWRYLPATKMIRALGISNNNSTFVLALVNGRRVVLVNNYKPSQDVFEVQIKPSLFRDFRNSSSD
jgi:hypothetical protein